MIPEYHEYGHSPAWIPPYLLRTAMMVSTCLLHGVIYSVPGARGDGTGVDEYFTNFTTSAFGAGANSTADFGDAENITSDTGVTLRGLPSSTVSTATFINSSSSSSPTPITLPNTTTTSTTTTTHTSPTTNTVMVIPPSTTETIQPTHNQSTLTIPVNVSDIRTTSPPTYESITGGDHTLSSLLPEGSGSDNANRWTTEGETATSGLLGNETTTTSNITYGRTLHINPFETFHLKQRTIYAIIAGGVAIVLIVIGKFACSKVEKRLMRSADEEYAYILEDAFSMATEENIWDARWTAGRDTASQRASVENGGDVKAISEETSLRSGMEQQHQRVTLHVPGTGPYGATESLIV